VGLLPEREIMLRTELDLGYFKWIHKPGAELGVFDNNTDYDDCKRRVHCNCTHGSIAPEPFFNEETKAYEIDKSSVSHRLDEFNRMETGRRRTIMTISEHNNVYFPNFIRYKKTLPQCLMQTIDGKYLELHDPFICEGEGIPMPAIDDATLTGLYSETLAEQARLLRENQYVAAYLLGYEMLYPEYFNLGHGDFRPESWQHFIEWCKLNGLLAPTSKESVVSDEFTSDSLKWYQFREQAMADRCVNYYRAVMNEDVNHLIYYPTHGSTLSDTRRAQLGQQPSTLACACDGMEMGHILINNDRERRNVIMTSFYSSFGAPVIVPRLGNKQVDLSAIGGGRSFTKKTLRRFVYESLGLGIEKIFPIHWSSRLHDGEWFIKDTEAEVACREVFDEIIGASDYLYGMGRLQPQVGILAADATWIEEWNPRWTGFLQDAYRYHGSMTIISDAIINQFLPRKMPVLLVFDNYRISDATLQAFVSYMDAGGKIILWGRFAEQREDLSIITREERDQLLTHKNVYVLKVPSMKEQRVLRELFLAGVDCGIAGPRFEYEPINYLEVEKAIQDHCPECILKTAQLASQDNLEEVNAYTLTDRASLIYLFINNGSTPVQFTFEPDHRLIQDYTLIDVVTEKKISNQIYLDANATKMVWVYHEVTEQTAEEKVLQAEKAFEGWMNLGADISALRHYYSHILTGEYKDKRYMLAGALLESLALKVDVTKSEEGLEFMVKVYNEKQKVETGACVTFRLTPGTFHRFECVEKEGEYTCFIPKNELPTYYDVKQKVYLPLQGNIRCILHAETENRQGGVVLNITL
jgi:hypothetical protein